MLPTLLGGPTSPILVDMVRVNGPRDDPPIFYHRFFHDHAEAEELLS